MENEKLFGEIPGSGYESTLSQKLDEIYKIIKHWDKSYAPLVGKIWLDKKTILRLLNVSESTLARWRAGEFGYKLPYEIDSSGNAYYLYDTVYESLQKGRISARGFDRLEAMARMQLYREDRIRELVLAGDHYMYDSNEA